MPLFVSAKGQRFLQMGALANQFRQRATASEEESAKVATEVSRNIYSRWSSGRPLAPARKGRATTGGTFADLLLWQRSGNGAIEFDFAALAVRTPTNTGKFSYALIQEIGTGQSGRILNGSGVGAISVPSQRGRRISPSLMWAVTDGGSASRPMTARNRAAASQAGSPGMEQLFARPAGQFGRAGRIRREIRGKHFIRDGGIAGFELLRERLETDFLRTFR